jgi:hypothetical protein
MNIPIETKPALWGAAGGAIALAIVGFSWLGWSTAGKAETMATTRADAAVVAALAPLCVDRFQGAADAAANRTALKAIDSWSQGDFVEKGGWASIEKGDPSSRLSAVAKACAELLTKT